MKEFTQSGMNMATICRCANLVISNPRINQVVNQFHDIVHVHWYTDILYTDWQNNIYPWLYGISILLHSEVSIFEKKKGNLGYFVQKQIKVSLNFMTLSLIILSSDSVILSIDRNKYLKSEIWINIIVNLPWQLQITLVEEIIYIDHDTSNRP